MSEFHPLSEKGHAKVDKKLSRATKRVASLIKIEGGQKMRYEVRKNVRPKVFREAAHDLVIAGWPQTDAGMNEGTSGLHPLAEASQRGLEIGCDIVEEAFLTSRSLDRYAQNLSDDLDSLRLSLPYSTRGLEEILASTGHRFISRLGAVASDLVVFENTGADPSLRALQSVVYASSVGFMAAHLEVHLTNVAMTGEQTQHGSDRTSMLVLADHLRDDTVGIAAYDKGQLPRFIPFREIG